MSNQVFEKQRLLDILNLFTSFITFAVLVWSKLVLLFQPVGRASRNPGVKMKRISTSSSSEGRG